jgi:hypothetical protein
MPSAARATTPATRPSPSRSRSSTATSWRTSIPDRSAAAVSFHEPGPAVDGADGQAAPEPVAPVGLVALALVHEPEAHAVPGEPADDVARVADERSRHRGIPAPQRHAAHVAEEVLLGVRLEIGVRQRLLGEQLAHVLQAAVGDADRPRGERRVAAGPRGVGLLEHEHAGAALAGGVRRGEAGVAGAGDDDVGSAHGSEDRRFSGSRSGRSPGPR